MSSWDDVGGNPCPGDATALRGCADALQSVADHGRDMESQLRSLHGGMGALRWAGAGADNITNLVEATLPGLATFWTAHDQASSALRSYVGLLEDLQSRAASALSDYSAAADDLAAASSAADDASQRYRGAQGQIVQLEITLRGLEAERLAMVGIHQSTASIDADIAAVNSQLSYQRARRDEAGGDASGAQSRIDDAKGRMDSARHLIDGYRDEIRAAAKTAADAILASIGVVRSNNPVVRALQDGVHDVATAAKWVDDNSDVLLSSWDKVAGMVGALALVCAPIPVVGEIVTPVLGVASTAMAVVSLVGHAYEAANGNQSWGSLAIEGVLLLPFGRVLGRMAKSDPGAFDNLPGIVKRLGWFDDARHAKSVFSSQGIKIIGSYRYRVHVVPKQVSGPPSVYKTLLVLKGGQRVLEKYDDVKDGVESINDLRGDVQGGPHHPATPSSPDDEVTGRASVDPNSEDAGQIQGSDVLLQGSTSRVQG